MIRILIKIILFSSLFCGGIIEVHAQEKASMQIFTNKVKISVSPNLHGIFFEESRIPPSAVLEGNMLNPNPTKKPHNNLYRRASNFKLPWLVKTAMPYWNTLAGIGGNIAATLSEKDPLTSATPQSAKVTISNCSTDGKVKGKFFTYCFQKNSITVLQIPVKITA